jgi:hypothetical protein
MEEGEEPEPHDHPNFAGNKMIIRRVSRRNHITFDKNLNSDRLTSALFKFNDPAGYLSCDSAVCVAENNFDTEAYVRSGGWDGAVHLTAQDFRATAKPGEPYLIGMAPLPGIPCHGAVWGKIGGSQSNRLLKCSDWLVGIPHVIIPH